METKASTRTIDQEMNEFTERFMLPDRVSHSPEMQWMPFSDDGCWFKPLRFDLTTGLWIMLFKVEKGAVLSRHRHTGGSVTGYVIEGKWHYLEKDWEANEGTLIFEPPGDIHTLCADPELGMTTLFTVTGSIQFFDANGTITREDDVFTMYKRYRHYCEEYGIEPNVDLIF
ncbi:2,4'-dihydroxyacetophenone dioxygenase family protein [Halalkalibacter krulwichiae]|uniref:ChrR Cupin-like domain protein n=1 Tax=Halalkalibacter krulwichiae TaxID=199441 RepID=A0A1X9MGQ6_9BACI|nr:2,4'-dihydroxyacetophenone dioxygenase family protein [Halalkalibacter krulwichiae]ARK31303.1 ChrR Cupin-like domain protein [Halalkalibacter krulwichiae]